MGVIDHKTKVIYKFLGRITYASPTTNNEFVAFDPILTILSCLLKAPMVPEGERFSWRLFWFEWCNVGFMNRYCLGKLSWNWLERVENLIYLIYPFNQSIRINQSNLLGTPVTNALMTQLKTLSKLLTACAGLSSDQDMQMEFFAPRVCNAKGRFRVRTSRIHTVDWYLTIGFMAWKWMN